MISEMSAVEIIGPMDLFMPTIEAVQDAGTLHIVETPLAELSRTELLSKIHLTEDQSRERDSCESTAQSLDEVIREIPGRIAPAAVLAGLAQPVYERLASQPLAALASRARELQGRVRSFRRREHNLTDDIKGLTGYEKVLAAFAPIVETHVLPRTFEMVGVIFERRNRLARDLLRREIARLKIDPYRFFEQPLAEGRLAVLIAFPRQESQRVRKLIDGAGIDDMLFPSHLRDLPFEEAFSALQKDLDRMSGERRGLREQRDRFFQERAAELIALRNLFRDRLARFDALPKLARTRHAFIIQGWLLSQGMASLGARLAGVSEGQVVLREVPHGAIGIPPVRLENGGPVKAFEPLLSLLPLPKYGTLDPTIYLATFFPPIYGLMLADVGYGAILLMAAAALYAFGRARKILRSLAIIAASCAFFTVVFGLVFGELFGELGRGFGLHPLWQERFSIEAGRSTSTLLGYLMLAIAVGAMQVLFGLVLGVVNARKTKDRAMALGNLARIAGLAVLFFFVGRMAKVLPPIFTSFGLVAAVLLLVLMVLQTMRHPTHGVLIPLEVLGAMGSILSYARIMAIGMASAVLSLLAAMLGGMISSVALAVLVVVLVHALNLVLGIIDPTIQGLRLHYVEFFSKFYLGGGRPYAPFKKLGGIAV
jgi:V/A-type H+-transporting ATPase subunit I